MLRTLRFDLLRFLGFLCDFREPPEAPEAPGGGGEGVWGRDLSAGDDCGLCVVDDCGLRAADGWVCNLSNDAFLSNSGRACGAADAAAADGGGGGVIQLMYHVCHRCHHPGSTPGNSCSVCESSSE